MRAWLDRRRPRAWLTVVPARVHAALMLALEFEAFRLVYGQCVDVGPQHDGRLAAADAAHDARLCVLLVRDLQIV
jgi:hypothetical protein